MKIDIMIFEGSFYLQISETLNGDKVTLLCPNFEIIQNIITLLETCTIISSLPE